MTDATDDQVVLFLHVFKAGGTSVHQAVTDGVAPDWLCSNRYESSQKTTEEVRADTADFLGYRLISGHFDWRRFDHLRLYRKCMCVTQLRDPLDRITSAYNFLRAYRSDLHPGLEAGGLQDRTVIEAAQRMSARDFFASSYSRNSPAFNNVYVQAFAPIQSQAAGGFSPDRISERADQAARRLAECAHVGRLDRQRDTVNLIRQTLGLGTINQVPHSKRTADEMTWHEWLKPVELVAAADLEPYVQPLIEGDRLIYEHAQRQS